MSSSVRYFRPSESNLHRREARARRAAARFGLHLLKSRSRTPSACGYGGYMIVDAYTGLVVVGGDLRGFSLSLEDVEDFLFDA